MTHYVSDLIIRIKNASLARRRTVVLPLSNISREIVKVLAKERFLDSIVEEVQEGRNVLVVGIRYEHRNPALTYVRVVSKPSLRVYIKAANIASIQRRGRKIAILSTSKGVMTGREAQKQGVGGELLFEVS